jgi:DNA mismatch repair protein MutS
VVGISNIDIYTGKTTLYQFKETYVNNPTTYDELERFISIYNPSEVIIIGNITNKEIDTIINYGNIQSKLIHRLSLLDEIQEDNKKRALNCEKQNYQKTVLEKFFNIVEYETFSLHFYQNVIATQAFCYLLDFIYQHNPNLVNKLEEPIFENCSDRLILANHSLKQLNIIDDGSYSGPFSSVDKLLNLCITPMGKRKFSYNLSNPTTDINYLQDEYNITDHILSHYSDEDFINQFKHKLSFMKDIPKILRLIILKKITPDSLFILYNNLKIIKEMYLYIQSDSIFMKYLTSRLNDVTNIPSYCDKVINILERNFDLSLCEKIDTFQQFETNFIKKGVDVDLDENTNILIVSNNKLESIRKYLNDNITKYEKKTKMTDFVKLHETEKNSFSLIATKRRCNILKEIFNNIHTAQTPTFVHTHCANTKSSVQIQNHTYIHTACIQTGYIERTHKQRI